MKKVLLLGPAMAATLLLAVGCDNSSTSPEASNVDGSNPVIAVVPKSTNLLFWHAVRAGAEQAGSEFGFEISWNGPDRETNSARQIQLIDDAMQRNVSGVVLAPVDRFALAPAVDRLAASKIPCAIIDSGVQSIQFVSFASTDNYAGGMLAARRMGKVLNGEGNVLVIRHLDGSQSTRRRVNGFVETLTNEFPAIKIADSQSGQDTVETAMETTEQMLKRNPDVQGLFACNITTSLGALQALEKANRSEVKMVAFDPDPALLDGMRRGQIDAIILQDPYKMGYDGVKALAMHLKGEPVTRIIDTGVAVATTESLSDPSIKRLLNLQGALRP